MSAGLASWRTGISARYRWRISSSVMPASSASTRSCSVSMNEGAIGLSTGLYYAPGSYSTTEEVIALARVAAQHGGIYDTHMRDESTYNIGLMNSVRETLRIGKEANIPVMISHIKALGADVWGQSGEVIALIDVARKAGVKASAR